MKTMKHLIFVGLILFTGCAGIQKAAQAVADASGSPTTRPANEAAHAGAGVVNTFIPDLGSGILAILSLTAAGVLKVAKSQTDRDNAGLTEGLQTIANAGVVGAELYNQLHPVAGKVVADAAKDATAVATMQTPTLGPVAPAATPKA